jgi:hypothetical protein
MKQLILVTFLMMSVFANAQEKDPDFVAYDVFPVIFENLPTSKENSFDFPINKKFTIKLHTTDSIHFDFSVIEFEKTDGVNYSDLPRYFSNDGTRQGTIEIYFTIGINGEYQPSGDTSARVVWVVKNWTEFDLMYDIETQESFFNKKFKPTTNSGVKAGAIAIEMWNEMLNDMRLSNLRIKETSQKK